MAAQDAAPYAAGRGTRADLDLLLSLSSEISGKVLCALGDFATSPVVGHDQQFRDEYVEHIPISGIVRVPSALD